MTEHIVIDGLRLGRRAPSNKPTLKVRDFLAAPALPTVPNAVDHLTGFPYEMGFNQKFGTCGPTSFANYVRLVTYALTGTMIAPTWADIKRLYVRQNPDFNEQTGDGDGGVDMKTMLADAAKYGFMQDANGKPTGPKVLGFAEIDVSNPEEVEAAVAIFGGSLLGLELDRAQSDQLAAGVWDYVESPQWGGHAVCEGSYEADEDEDVITWAQRVKMTRKFVTEQRQEAYVVILDTHLGSRQFMAGWDLPRFAEAYKQITGRPFPATIPPTPLPPQPPQPSDPDATLAESVHDWVFNKHHTGTAKIIADALAQWFRATGRA